MRKAMLEIKAEAFEFFIWRNYRTKETDVGNRESYKYWREVYALCYGEAGPTWECIGRTDGKPHFSDTPDYTLAVECYLDKDCNCIAFPTCIEHTFFDALKEFGLYGTGATVVDYEGKVHKEGEAW